MRRFQVGGNGDGAEPITTAEAAGYAPYASVVRILVAEERNHARLLALPLTSGGASLIASHGSDRIFVAPRRRFAAETARPSGPIAATAR